MKEEVRRRNQIRSILTLVVVTRASAVDHGRYDDITRHVRYLVYQVQVHKYQRMAESMTNYLPPTLRHVVSG